MIYLLAAVTFFILIVTYKGVKNDLMHPAVITIGAMFISIIAALYNVDLWGIQYHLNTFILVTCSLICISLSGILMARMKMRKQRKSWIVNRGKYNLQNISIDNIVLVLIIVFNLFVTVWYYYIIVKTTGGGALKEMLASFRMIHSYGATSSTDVSMPAILNQCLKLDKVLAYLFVMIFMNNLYATGQKDWCYLIPPVLFCLQTLLGSDRIYIVCLVGSSVVMAYIMWHKKNGWARNNSKEYIKICASSLIILLIFFFCVRNLVGHNSQNQINNPLEYLTQYIGGSIQLLDMFIQDPQIPSDAKWGEECFSSIYKTIVQLQGGIPAKRHMEFRVSNGIIIGNIYTAIRKYYYDYGSIGVVILSCIFGLFFGYIYRKLQQEEVTNMLASYRLCIYCFIVHCTFFFSLDDLFFSGVISVNFFSMFIYMWIAYYFLVKKPIRFKL